MLLCEIGAYTIFFLNHVNKLAYSAFASHHRPVLQALGMEDAAYRALLDLQFRDVTPEDYALLTFLDETVKPKSLEHKKHVRPAPSRL